MKPSEQQMQALVGHEFPGGQYRIQHWENFLLSEATGSEQLPDGLAHPAHLFHVPIAGAGISIADLFELCAAPDDASVTIDYYHWEFDRPLREGERYTMRGGVVEHSRRQDDGGPTVDSVTFQIDVVGEDGERAARSTFRWHFWRFAA